MSQLITGLLVFLCITDSCNPIKTNSKIACSCKNICHHMLLLQNPRWLRASDASRNSWQQIIHCDLQFNIVPPTCRTAGCQWSRWTAGGALLSRPQLEYRPYCTHTGTRVSVNCECRVTTRVSKRWRTCHRGPACPGTWSLPGSTPLLSSTVTSELRASFHRRRRLLQGSPETGAPARLGSCCGSRAANCSP